MQDRRTLLTGALLVAAMIVLVAVLGRKELPDTVLATGETLWLPQLKPALGDIRRVHIASASASVNLLRGENGWGVEERDAYPADFARLNELLQALADARVLEPKTAKSEFFARLGLDDPEKPESRAILVELRTDAEQPLLGVLIGDEAEGRGGRYVRGAAEQQSWLIDTSPQPLADPGDWLRKTLVGIEFDRVASVSRHFADGSGFSVARGDAGPGSNLAPGSLPAGKKPKYQGVFDGAARAILSASVEDVKRAPASEQPGEDSPVRTTIGFFNGLQIAVDASKGEDGSWVSFDVPAVEVPAAEAATPEQEQQSDAEHAGQDKAQETAAKPDPAAEARELKQRLDGWQFKVSDYVYGELVKPLDDYIENEQPEKEKSDDADAG